MDTQTFLNLTSSLASQTILNQKKNWESAKVTHKGVFMRFRAEKLQLEIAQAPQKTVFALPGSQHRAHTKGVMQPHAS